MDKQTDKSEGTTPTRNDEGRERIAVRDGLAEIHARLYEAADNLGGGALAGELESVARLAAKLLDASPIRLVYGSLEAVDTLDLTRELMRRGCAVAVIDHGDVADQWQMNQDADGTDEPKPTEQETRDALACVQKLLEKTLYDNACAFQWGPTSDACELIAKWRKEGRGA